MKVRLRVGSVSLQIEGMDLSKRHIVDLMQRMTTIALMADVAEVAVEEERPALGFTSSMERAGEFVEPGIYWEDED